MIIIDRKQPVSFWANKANFPLVDLFFTVYKTVSFKKLLLGYDIKNPFLFTSVNIETYNRCNNDCPFCPANKNVDGRKPIFMKRKMFSKIINQLKELNYGDYILLYNNNEPLLDKRLEEFIRETVKKLPSAKLLIMTNGILLTKKRLEDLYRSGLREIVIDNYNDRLELLPNIKKLLGEIENSNLAKEMLIKVWLRYKNAVITNRAGFAPNKTKVKKLLVQMRKCIILFTQLNINPKGEVHICCCDVYYKNIIGDLNEERIMDIWKGEKITAIRKEILKNGRKNLYPCNACDAL